mmetsp:Transcript_21054/g.35659  ORF Transcript_21054/g.35659 Transcript_21054/m.35659 type:complete len:462 (+) Transcript_21054:110-1495(+)
MLAESGGGVQIRTFYLYENERYSPLSNWSAESLLPTDRHAFTTSDTTDGFSNLSDASIALLSQGWSWLSGQDWTPDMNLDNIDEEGWTYAVNFSDFKDTNSGTNVKSILHFARRRRLLRYQIFDVKLICAREDLTCSYCDLQEIDKLSNLFLDKLSEASAVKHPARISEVKTVNLKKTFMEVLQLDDLNDKETYTYDGIEQRMQKLIESSKSNWSTASSMFTKDKPVEIVRKRMADLSQFYFTSDEAQEIARLVLRKLDRKNAFHCKEPACGEECPFFVVQCAYDGCGMHYSKKWSDVHEAGCPHKTVPCTRKCGLEVKRMDMCNHLEDECELRTVRCPLYDFGCKEEMLAKDMKKHTVDAQEMHLALAMGRMKEIQDVINNQQKRIHELENTVTYQQESIQQLTLGVAAGAAAIKASETRSEHAMKHQVGSLASKVNANTAEIGSCRTELKAIRTYLTPK